MIKRTAMFSHIDTWICDLDNTLYPASANLFALTDVLMAGYIIRLLAIDTADAVRLQKHYFRTYGTTLAGLMAEHKVDPDDYLKQVHDVPLDRIGPDPELAGNLTRLPGRKLVFTNADAAYAWRVLERRGLADCFEAVFDIRDAGYVPKPELEAYQLFCERFSIDPARAVMFEDMARNLHPAKALGMGTVWINNGSEHGDAEACPSFIDYETHDLGHWLARQTGAKDA